MFLFEKPWLTTGSGDYKELRSREEIRLSQTKSGLRMLISAMSVIFLLTIVTYVVRMKINDWQSLSEPRLLWINTAFLVLSSMTMQWTVYAARREQSAQVKLGFLVAGLFAWTFLAGQLWAWQLLHASGHYVASNPANSFFYMITALHALHLLGGLGVWMYSLFKMKQDFQVADIRSSIELCTIYWHFLLIIWGILFSLLLLT